MPPDPPGKIQDPQNGTAGRSKQDPAQSNVKEPSASAGVQEEQESTTNPIPQQDKAQSVKNAPSASTNLEATQSSTTAHKSTAKSKSSTLFGKATELAYSISPVGVLETREKSLNLGTGMAVKNALIQAFICEDFRDFYVRKGSSQGEQRKIWDEQEAEIDEVYIDLKNETGVDLGEVRIYNDPQANELCINQGKLALVCPQGVLLASPYIDYNLLSLSIKQLGNSFRKFKLKGDSTWGLHYLKIQEMLPIFRLVDAASSNLFKNFDEGDFFYKLGAGGVNDIKAVFGTSSLEVPNMLTEAYIELVKAAVEDSADGYVLFGTKEKSQNAFAEYFGVPYNPSNIAMANKAIEKMMHIAIPGKTFIDHGTPDWNTWWRDDEDHTEEMKLRNSYLEELEEGLGDAMDDSVVASILQAIKRIKDNEDPKKYLEWKDDYNLVYDNVKKLTKNIQDNSEPILTNAYGKYGEFYFDMLWEIAWSKVYAFATETAVSVLVGGGVGAGAAAGKAAAKFVGKKIAQKVGKKAAQEAGKEAAKQGAKEVVKEGTKQVVKEGAKEAAEEGAEEVAKKTIGYYAKEGGIRLLREGVENGIMTGIENADAIFGDREVNGFEALLSWGIGTASGFGLGILGDFAKGKIKAKKDVEVTDFKDSEVAKTREQDFKTNDNIEFSRSQIAELERKMAKNISDISDIDSQNRQLYRYIAKQFNYIEGLIDKFNKLKEKNLSADITTKIDNETQILLDEIIINAEQKNLNKLIKQLKNQEAEKQLILKQNENLSFGVKLYNQFIPYAENEMHARTRNTIREVTEFGELQAKSYARWETVIDLAKGATGLKIAKESTRALNFDSGPGEIPAEEKAPKEEEKAPKEESFPEEYANQCFEKVKEEEIEEDNEPIYYEDERLQKCF